MKTIVLIPLTALLICAVRLSPAQQFSLGSAPPVVVRTAPPAGADDVDPATTEIRVTYSKQMQAGAWSWTNWGKETLP